MTWISVLALLLSAAGSAALAWAARQGGGSLRATRLALAVLLALSEATLVLWPVATGGWSDASSLPLQLSDLATVLAIGALCCANCPRWGELAYLLAIPSALLALAFPAPGAVPPSPLYYGFWVDHGSLLAAGAVLATSFPLRMSWTAVVRAWGATALLAAVDGVVNLVTGGDYMFLRQPPSGWSPLRVMGPWPVYVLTALVLCPLVFLAIAWPIWGQRRAHSAKGRW